jgi:hypothetical protein
MHSQGPNNKSPATHNNFIEEDGPVLDEEQHFVGTSLVILIFSLGILILGDIDSI